MTTSNMRCSLSRLFPGATLRVPGRKIAMDQEHKRLVVPNCKLPRCTYGFAIGVAAMLYESNKCRGRL
jgi:hypothetical protein